MSTTLSFAVADHVVPDRFVPGGTGLPGLAAAAAEIRNNRHSFVSWLDGLSQDADAVRAVARRSYWHPNGFAKLVLHTSAEPEFRIRLHVWPKSAKPSRGESNPHSHRWEFASTVLAGEGMHMVEYEENAERGKPYRRYWYGTDPADPAALVSDDDVRLKRVRPPHVWHGEVYTCDTAIVHTVRPVSADLTATVVVQGPRRTPTTVVYCAPGESDDQPNRPLSESDFQLLVKSVVEAVA
jgi:hypothetical protein